MELTKFEKLALALQLPEKPPRQIAMTPAGDYKTLNPAPLQSHTEDSTMALACIIALITANKKLISRSLVEVVLLAAHVPAPNTTSKTIRRLEAVEDSLIVLA